MNRFVSTLSLASVLALCTTVHSDWMRFRGPNGTGISSEDKMTPVNWSPDRNLKWKAALPGPGSSSPIVVGDKVFVTCWSGYGVDRGGDPGDQADLRRHLMCFDRNTGNKLWSEEVEPVLPEDRYGGNFAEHGYASHTPVSDGERVFTFLGKTGVLAYDMDGNKLWQQSVGTESGANNWGTASSPILFKGLVIVPATAESESIIGLDKETGKEVWRAEAAGFNSTWGSPALVKVNDSRTDLVMAIPGEIWGINPNTGKLAWYADGIQTRSFRSSAVVDTDGVVYALESGRGGGGGIAIKAGGSKDVSNSHVVWSGRQSGSVSTPLVHDGKLYTVARKTVTCVDATTGEEVFKARLRSASGTAREPEPESRGDQRGGFGRGGRGGFGRGGRGGGQDYGSPIMADGKIYYTTRTGETFVLKVGDKFEQLAANRVTADREDFSATPAISNGLLFMRSNKHLYCVAE